MQPISVILIGMTHKVGPKGQVVIPKELREQLGMIPGMKVDFTLSNGGVDVRPHRARQSLGGSFKDIDLVADLLAERAHERG